jgi:hypothetical protein
LARSCAFSTACISAEKYTGATNAQIGELFGGISYSEVAKIAQSFSKQIVDDKVLRGRIKNLLEHISIFKTPKISPYRRKKNGESRGCS